ncbi:alpha-amylase [Paenibacillus daejeonensis]|uniref:alpha-amylase n=1 Tax=Paenibacillus daejeonensis TaxID=135193 RepID=UPI000368172C|nr:alpha-amylase [Paenibacillus daejeonensis]
MKRNQTMMQFFEWFVEPDGEHWNRLKERAAELSERGITAVWIPPVTKGQSDQDTGYGIYDLYDLGEFDQKGTVRTKYGTKDQLLEAIQTCREHGIAVYTDLVMNHKAGADETETFDVVEVAEDNRQEDVSEPFQIEGWTKFTFPGRGDTYSSFKWSYEHFNGTDYDAGTDRSGIFRIIHGDKQWNNNVDDRFGNYDYLMFANIDYHQEQVREEMIRWGHWIADTTGCGGFRLDAIKHIDYEFVRQFVEEVGKPRGDEFFIVGEFWNEDADTCRDFLGKLDYSISLFDVSLHYKLHQASLAGPDFDLTALFHHNLVDSHPMNAVTFVDNHDTQPGEALESWVGDSFKQSAYAIILLRENGYPCVFYGDYYGINGEEPIPDKKEAIDPLLYARYHKAYGEQEDYLDHPSTVGWVRRGDEAIERSGCAVVISNDEEGFKRMYVGEHRAGEIWLDLTNTREDKIVIGEDGWADFPVNGCSLSVWALPEFDVE